MSKATDDIYLTAYHSSIYIFPRTGYSTALVRGVITECFLC